MGIFDKLTQAVDDYDVLWMAVRSSQQQAADITAAVAARIAADQTGKRHEKEYRKNEYSSFFSS